MTTELLIGLVLVVVVLWLTTRVYGQRPDTVQEIVVKMTKHVEEANRVLGERLAPAMLGVVAAFQEFEAVLKEAHDENLVR